jgi:hypothetical protein
MKLFFVIKSLSEHYLKKNRIIYANNRLNVYNLKKMMNSFIFQQKETNNLKNYLIFLS